MPAKTLRATVALATIAAVQACEICHLHYFHKDVASPTAMTSGSYCREYQSQACCTTQVALEVGDAQKGYLYPDHNPADGCGQLSSACEKFFIEEGCFYECDHNVGKWRAHDDCGADGTGNEWQIEAMPIKASYCDAWYEACRGADNKLCMGSASTEGAPEYGYFSQPVCHEEQGTGGCRRIDEVYTSGFHMCETMWSGSFRYENDTSADAYVMSFDEGTANPNNAVFQNKNYPTVCPASIGGGVNLTLAEEEGCDVDVVSYLIGADSNFEVNATDAPSPPPPPTSPLSAEGACPGGISPDISIENFPAAHRIATDDAAYGASYVTVASDFSVHYDTYFKVVRTYCGTHTPYSCVPRTYVLTLCGATAPTTFTNGTALPEDAKHFTIPVTGIGLPGSTPVTFVEMLDLRDAIELVNPQYVHSPCVQKLEETEQIDTVDTDWAARAAAHEDVQVVFTDSWNTAQIDKDVVFDASSNPGALARAEWIKFMSVFFNEEEKANLYFAREKAAFEATAASTASLSAALYADAANRKTCAWVQKYQSYNADWSLGAIEYHVSYSVYKQELCVGAGMTPATDAVDLALDAPAYKMVFTSLADFHAKLVTYDVIIDETYQSAPLDATKDVVLTSLGIDAADTSGALKAGALLLRVDAHVTDAVTNLTDANSNALDWYESAIARPALVLTDLAHRAWPDDIAAPPAGCSRYFRDVLADEMPTVNGKDQCDTWLAAENEQMCLNNPVLVSDAELEGNATYAPSSPPPPSHPPSAQNATAVPPPPTSPPTPPPPKSFVFLADYESSAGRVSVLTVFVVILLSAL